MKVIITGTTGLAKAIAGALANDHYVKTTRIEDIIDNHVTWWGFEQYDVLINHAHKDFDQTKILEIAYRAWEKDSGKLIVNISSRASQPNNVGKLRGPRRPRNGSRPQGLADQIHPRRPPGAR